MKQILKMNAIFSRLLVLISLTISLPGYSQTLEESAPNRPDHLAQILILSEDQKHSFLEILEAQHSKREAIRESYRTSREAEREEMKALHQDTLQQLQSVLTEDQITQFDEIEKRRRPPHPIDRVEQGVSASHSTF